MTIQQLHEDLKAFKKISPLLLMRRTKQTFEACVELCKKINALRNEQGIVEIGESVKFGQKNRVKYRKIVNGLTK